MTTTTDTVGPTADSGDGASLLRGVTGTVQKPGRKSEEGLCLTPVAVDAGPWRGPPLKLLALVLPCGLPSWLVGASSEPGGWVPRENPREPAGSCAAFKNLIFIEIHI